MQVQNTEIPILATQPVKAKIDGDIQLAAQEKPIGFEEVLAKMDMPKPVSATVASVQADLGDKTAEQNEAPSDVDEISAKELLQAPSDDKKRSTDDHKTSFADIKEPAHSVGVSAAAPDSLRPKMSAYEVDQKTGHDEQVAQFDVQKASKAVVASVSMAPSPSLAMVVQDSKPVHQSIPNIPGAQGISKGHKNIPGHDVVDAQKVQIPKAKADPFTANIQSPSEAKLGNEIPPLQTDKPLNATAATVENGVKAEQANQVFIKPNKDVLQTSQSLASDFVQRKPVSGAQEYQVLSDTKPERAARSLEVTNHSQKRGIPQTVVSKQTDGHQAISSATIPSSQGDPSLPISRETAPQTTEKFIAPQSRLRAENVAVQIPKTTTALIPETTPTNRAAEQVMAQITIQQSSQSVRADQVRRSTPDRFPSVEPAIVPQPAVDASARYSVSNTSQIAPQFVPVAGGFVDATNKSGETFGPRSVEWGNFAVEGENRPVQTQAVQPSNMPFKTPAAEVVTRQLAEALRTSATPYQAQIELDPAELGRVRLNLIPSDGAMTLAVLADRAETAELLRRNIDQLAQDFRELGYQELTFTFQQNSDPEHEGSGQNEFQDESGVPNTAKQLPDTQHTIVADGRVNLRSDGVDIRV